MVFSIAMIKSKHGMAWRRISFIRDFALTLALYIKISGLVLHVKKTINASRRCARITSVKAGMLEIHVRIMMTALAITTAG